MAFFAVLELAPGRRVTVFRSPDRREWRELEEANDPLDGVRGFVVGPDFYAWAPAALHGEVEGPLAAPLGAGGDWLPVAVLTLLGEVVVTSSFDADREGRNAAEGRIRACPALRRRFRRPPAVSFAREFEEAA